MEKYIEERAEYNNAIITSRMDYSDSLLHEANNSPLGLLPDTWNCGLSMRREYRERIPRHRGLAIPTSITARAWRTCRDALLGSLTSSLLWSRWRGKRSRHSRCMRNPQFYVSGKRPIQSIAVWPELCSQDRISKTQFPPYQGRIKIFALASRGTQDQLLPPIYYTMDVQSPQYL